jgi:hypothetical protein
MPLRDGEVFLFGTAISAPVPDNALFQGLLAAFWKDPAERRRAYSDFPQGCKHCRDA